MRKRVIWKAVGAVAAIGAAGAGPASAAGPDAFVTYFDRTTATGGGPAIGGQSYYAPRDEFWVVGFTGAGQGIRQIQPTEGDSASLTYDPGAGKFVTSATFPATVTALVSESDWNRLVRASSLEGDGVTHVATWNGQATPGNLQLNPTTLTVAGITYAPGTLGVLVDAANPTSGGATPADAKAVYVFDLRRVGSEVEPGSRDRNGNGIVDWNDVFDVVASRQDLMTAGGLTGNTFNIARNFAFSGDGKSIYVNDSASVAGGIWRVDLELTGPAAARRIATITADPRVNTEPAVLTTAARRLDPTDPTDGDQIIFEGSSANGAGISGGLAYLIHDLAADATSPVRTLVHGTRVQAFTGQASSGADSVTIDAAGNIYFQEEGSNALLRLDTQGRLSKLVGVEQHRTHQISLGAATQNTNFLDLQARTVTVTKGQASFELTEVLYGLSGAISAPTGILAFDAADLDRDGAVTAADTALFIAQYDRALPAGGLPRDDATYQDYLKADLNGSAVHDGAAPAGIKVPAVDDRDLLVLFQFINKLPGDANLDGTVDAADQAIVAANLGQPGSWLRGDFDRNGTVDAADEALLTANLGQTYSLAGFDPAASYAGGAAGTWADVRKASNAAPDADTIVTVARAGGAVVSVPGGAAGTSVAHLTVGSNVGATTELRLEAGATLASTEGVHVRPAGAIAGPADATLAVGIPGVVSAAVAVEDGGALTGDLRIRGSLHYANSEARTFGGTIEDHGSNAASVVKFGQGTLALTGVNTYTGTTTINGGVLEASPGVGLPAASTLQLRGGVLQGAGTFERPLGTAAGAFNFGSGGGGFAAKGATLTVDVTEVTSLTWATTGFVPSGSPLMFGSSDADALVDFVDGISLGTSTTASATREVRVADNPASASDVARISGVVSGTDRYTLDKTGPGTLELAAEANTYAGPTVVSGGTLRVSGSIAASSGVTVNAGAAFEAASSQALASLTVNAGGTARVAAGPGSSPSSPSPSPLVLRLGAAPVVDDAGAIDLADGALVTPAGTLSEVQALVARGRAPEGTWAGAGGIASSAAAADPLGITGLAVVENDRGDGSPLISTLGTTEVALGEVIVRHTYQGDADVSGDVTADDYLQIDAGFLSHHDADAANDLAGYRWGDFNYDGRIDAADYFLIDRSYALQSTTAVAGGASASAAAVPEPSSAAAALAFAAAGLMNRRRHRRRDGRDGRMSMSRRFS